MKKILFIVVLIAMLFACNYKPKNITGVVQKFEVSEMGIFVTKNPVVTFSDGRIVYLKNMPEKTIETGSEIVIWYTGENAEFVFNDSIIVIKPAPLVTESLTVDDFTLPLATGDFERLVNLVAANGVNMTKSDCQYVYLDKLGNRHTMISIRRTDSRADSKLPVSQISVWVSNKNKPEGEILFSYIIKPTSIEFASDADVQVIKTATRSLLVMAGK